MQYVVVLQPYGYKYTYIRWHVIRLKICYKTCDHVLPYPRVDITWVVHSNVIFVGWSCNKLPMYLVALKTMGRGLPRPLFSPI